MPFTSGRLACAGQFHALGPKPSPLGEWLWQSSAMRSNKFRSQETKCYTETLFLPLATAGQRLRLLRTGYCQRACRPDCTGRR